MLVSVSLSRCVRASAYDSHDNISKWARFYNLNGTVWRRKLQTVCDGSQINMRVCEYIMAMVRRVKSSQAKPAFYLSFLILNKGLKICSFQFIQ